MTFRLKFRQPSKKFGYDCEYFAQNAVLIKNCKFFSQKGFFSSKNFPGHPASSSDEPRVNFLPIIRNLLPRSPRTIEIFLLPRKPFSSERYTGQVDCRFENSTGNFQPTLSYFSSQNPRITKKKKHFKEKIIVSSKCSSGHLECRFHKSIGNFTHEIQVFLAHNPELRTN